MGFLLILGVVLIASFNLTGDVHWPPWYLLTLFGLGFFSYFTYRKYGVIEALVVGYTTVSAVTFAFLKPVLTGPTAEVLMLKFLSLETALILMLLMLCFNYFDTLDLKCVFYGLIAVFVLQMATMYIDHYTGSKTIGILGNKSIGSSYLVIVGMMGQIGILLSVLFTLAFFKSGISFIALLVAWTTVRLLRRDNYYVTFGAAIPAISAIPLFESYGYNIFKMPRWEGWTMYFNEWWNNGNIWFGSGPGSFLYFGPKIQLMNQFRVDQGLWLWAHNDWLQLLIESGIIGVSIYFLFYLKICRNFYRAEYWGHLGACIAFGVVMLGNYPTNIAIFSVLAFYLIASSYQLGATWETKSQGR